MENHLYNVNINWSQDRKGVMCSPELTQNNDNCLEVATPPEFPKGIPGIWSPEHLFTAAVSSCLMTTFLAVAENFKLDFINFSCESKGMLGKADKGLQMTEVELHPVVTIPDESQRELALKVLNKSERACLITNSIKSSVVMKPQIEIKKK
ncbi:MAG: OsmC family protein [Ekhidna sp.]|nr:OsmC family protein [Ekhidna sp.]